MLRPLLAALLAASLLCLPLPALAQSNGYTASGGGSFSPTTLSQDLSCTSGGVCTVLGSSSTSTFYLDQSTVQWQSGVAAPTLTQAVLGSVATPSSILVAPQAPNGGSGTAAQNTPGSFVVNVATPGATGTAGNEAAFKFERNASLFATVQSCVGFSGADSCLYLGPSISPSSTNPTIRSDGTNTVLNTPGSGSIYLESAATVLTTITSTAYEFNSPATVEWAAAVASPTITQLASGSTSSGSGSAGQTTTLSAQAGQAATGASNNGGAGGPLVLSGGAGGTSGSATAGIGSFVELASGVTWKTTQVSASSYAVDTNSTTSDFLILTDSTSNAITVTLPTPTAGRYLCVKDRTGEAATHNVTVSHHASETIDGASTIVFTKNYDAVCVASNGTNWSVVSEYSSSIVP